MELTPYIDGDVQEGPGREREVDEVGDFRPIDALNMLVRVLTSTQIQTIWSWIQVSTHPSQKSTHWGAILATTEITCVAEHTLQLREPCFPMC